jgi:hypothetical protein
MKRTLTSFKSHRNYIQNNNLNPFLRQKFNDISTNASRSTCDQHNLLVPVICILLPIIENTTVEIGRDCANKAPVEEELYAREGRRMQNREVGAFLGVFGCEEEEQGESWIESCLLKQSSNWISGETWGELASICCRRCHRKAIPSRGSHPLCIGIVAK